MLSVTMQLAAISGRDMLLDTPYVADKKHNIGGLRQE